jgi:hypothetical protein
MDITPERNKSHLGYIGSIVAHPKIVEITVREVRESSPDLSVSRTALEATGGEHMDRR